MMMKPFVLCVDQLPPAMRELMIGEKPEELDLVFAESPEASEGVEKARNADYILCSWAPVPGPMT